ncbi:hypothetical protein V565_028260 [Rhizoctonia solani 123E]|uniref:Transmembrane protein n=1 Tax=Rhizoctonia solani 123E TaxID=1423351 RepID=A0A074S9S1_9AGAM|nr:hypothetical protein V565_028260 [Rhizoctonia solani 123E]
MQFYNAFTLVLASALASTSFIQSAVASRNPTTVTSASLATITEIINLTSTITVSGTFSASLTDVQPTEIATTTTKNATFSVAPTESLLTSLPSSASVCDTATPSIITSVVTQVSTKTVDHFITVTVGGSAPRPSGGNNLGSKGQAGNLGQPSQNTSKAIQAPTSAVEKPTPVITTIKPVTTVVVEQTTTVFATSFVTTTVRVQAGETRTLTAMVSSTVTSIGMATHTRTKTSTILITSTKSNTPQTATSTISQAALSTSEASSTPCPTDPVTLTVTRSANEGTATTSKFGIKDNTTTSRSTRSTRSTASVIQSTSAISSSSRSVESKTASTTRSTSTAKTSRSATQSTTDADISTLVTSTRSGSSDATSSTKGGRTRTRSFVVSTTATLTSQSTQTATTSTLARVTTSVRATRSASSTVSRFSTSVISTRTGGNTRTRTSSAPTTGATNSADPQTSLELDPRAVMSALANDGQDTPAAGQVASLTSRNNFINFCSTQNVPLTNGQQIKSGSCNGVPMGRILSVDKMPSSKFVFPKNGQTVQANTPFTIRMAIKNLSTGNFVNPATNYYGAPAQTTADGTLVGHSHVVVEKLTSKRQIEPTDPQKFAFFKGLNQVAEGGILTADVTSGLPAGEYRIASINSAANHQPALSAVAQRGSNDDISYVSILVSMMSLAIYSSTRIVYRRVIYMAHDSVKAKSS